MVMPWKSEDHSLKIDDNYVWIRLECQCFSAECPVPVRNLFLTDTGQFFRWKSYPIENQQSVAVNWRIRKHVKSAKAQNSEKENIINFVEKAPKRSRITKSCEIGIVKKIRKIQWMYPYTYFNPMQKLTCFLRFDFWKIRENLLPRDFVCLFMFLVELGWARAVLSIGQATPKV